MGLDQFAILVSKGGTDFDYSDDDVIDKQFACWRKFYSLDRWMRNLYNEKGGTKSFWNCIPLRLTIDDIERLERDCKNDNFYDPMSVNSEHESGDVSRLKKFLKQAKKVLSDGKEIYYMNWW